MFAVDLSDGGEWNGSDVELSGVLVAADPLLGEGDQLFGGGLLAGVE